MITDDEARFEELSRALHTAVDQAIEPWVRDAVASRVAGALDAELAEMAQAAGAAARIAVGAELAALFEADVDAQHTNPLAVLRQVVRYPTQVLRRAGVRPVGRDDDARRLHPDDDYDLTPGAFSDFGPEVHDAGLGWGAAKAHLHLQRRRAEGQR